MQGIVYVASNPSMPGLVKLGVTTNLPDRLRHLWATNIPLPFGCMFAWLAEDVFEVERCLHDTFQSDRVHPKREFFTTSPVEVIRWLLNTDGDVFPINNFDVRSAEWRFHANEQHVEVAVLEALDGETTRQARSADDVTRRIRAGQNRASADGKQIGRQPAMTPEQVHEARRMAEEQGMGYSAIGRILGRDKKTVKRAVEGLGAYVGMVPPETEGVSC